MFALYTLFLLFLLIPGILFRRFYYTEEFSKQFFKENIAQYIFASFTPSLIFHLLYYFIVLCSFSNIELGSFINLLSNDNEDYRDGLDSIKVNFNYILLHNISLWGISAGSGFLCKFFIRRNKLDRKIKFFRFKNEWHYLFTGEILDFPRISSYKKEQIDFKYADVLVDTSEGLIIYSGVLEEYVLNSQSGLDRIYLSNCARRFVKDENSESPTKKYYLPGEYLCLEKDKIVNIHIIYYSLQQM